MSAFVCVFMCVCGRIDREYKITMDNIWNYIYDSDEDLGMIMATLQATYEFIPSEVTLIPGLQRLVAVCIPLFIPQGRK